MPRAATVPCVVDAGRPEHLDGRQIGDAWWSDVWPERMILDTLEIPIVLAPLARSWRDFERALDDRIEQAAIAA